MSDLMEYKECFGTVEYSAADAILYGRVLDIKGLISYEGDSLQSLREDFESAVDEYIQMCDAEGVDPLHTYTV
jgi:predicted HicB family RNase H-like nuclease